MTFHGNVCFDELTPKDGQHLRVRHMFTPVYSSARAESLPRIEIDWLQRAAHSKQTNE